jgi:hypothetical protein
VHIHVTDPSVAMHRVVRFLLFVLCLVPVSVQLASIWPLALAIYLVWAALFYLLWGYAIYTLAGFPPLRFGEFLIGCGVACVVHGNQPVPKWLAHGRYWYPALSIILLYNLERQKHWVGWLCLNEDSSDKSCALWRHGQVWVEASPPCFFSANKILNKSALAWAALIYGLARAELEGETVWYMRVLQADVFKFLSGLSMTLYVNHISFNIAIKWLGQTLLGWQPSDWNDDTILMTVYLACYGLHRLIVCCMAWLLKAQCKEHEIFESKQLLAMERDEQESGHD